MDQAFGFHRTINQIVNSNAFMVLEEQISTPTFVQIAFLCHSILTTARIGRTYKTHEKGFIYALLLTVTGVLGGGMINSFICGEPLGFLKNNSMTSTILVSFLTLYFMPFLDSIVLFPPIMLLLGIMASFVRTMGVVGGVSAASVHFSKSYYAPIVLGTIGGQILHTPKNLLSFFFCSGSGGAYLPYVLNRIFSSHELNPTSEISNPSL